MSYTMFTHHGVAGISVERLAAVVVLFAAVALLLKDVRVEAAIRPVEGAGTAMWCSPAATISREPVAASPVATPKPSARATIEEPMKALAEPASAKPRAAPGRARTTVAAAPALSRAPPAELEMSITRPAVPVKPAARSTEKRSHGSTAAKAAARAEISANKLTKALSLLTAPSESMAHDPEHLALLAVTLVGLRRFDEASGIYAALIAIDRDDARAWVGLAVCDAQRGRSARSVEAYREAARLASNDTGLVGVVEAELAGVG